jgi:MTH538 TIR-like domain (DUF1863)
MGNDDNPFDPKFGQGLLRFLDVPSSLTPTNALASWTLPAPTPGIGDLLNALSPPSPLASLYGAAASDLFGPPKGLTGIAVSDLFGSPPASPYSLGAPADVFAPTLSSPLGLGVGALFGHFPSTDPPAPFGALYASPAPAPYAPPTPPKPKPVAPAVKRKAFFSFHYDDIMRVNVVRNAWKIEHPENALMRSFYDSSLWESRKLEGDEAVKRLIRDGVCNTSAVCVLAGSDTWERQWVRYEIARAIIDGRGLLIVHLNSIRHHVTKTPHTRGLNPLSFMAIGKVQAHGLQPVRYYLFERRLALNGVGNWEWVWDRYDDYMLAVELPGWVNDPKPGYVTPLSDCAAEYDYIAENGHRNIGSWIDLAAQRAGR